MTKDSARAEKRYRAAVALRAKRDNAAAAAYEAHLAAIEVGEAEGLTDEARREAAGALGTAALARRAAEKAAGLAVEAEDAALRALAEAMAGESSAAGRQKAAAAGERVRATFPGLVVLLVKAAYECYLPAETARREHNRDANLAAGSGAFLGRAVAPVTAPPNAVFGDIDLGSVAAGIAAELGHDGNAAVQSAVRGLLNAPGGLWPALRNLLAVMAEVELGHERGVGGAAARTRETWKQHFLDYIGVGEPVEVEGAA